jgi:hypothetical protein
MGETRLADRKGMKRYFLVVVLALFVVRQGLPVEPRLALSSRAASASGVQGLQM